MFCVVQVLFLVFMAIEPADFGHILSSTISFKPTGNPNEVNITYSYGEDDDECFTGIETEGDLECISGCDGDIAEFDVFCTNVGTNWITGSNTITRSFNSTVVEFIWDECCWESNLFIGSDSEVSAYVNMNLAVRSDTMMINSSPVTIIQPITRLQNGCTHGLQIPVIDTDGDTVRCRWSVGKLECESMCNGTGDQDAVLDEENCLLTFSPTIATKYAIALQVEDFASETDTTPLSSVPLQFTLEVFNSSDPCDAIPMFVEPTPDCTSTITINLGETFMTDLVAVSGTSSTNITAIDTIAPSGMTKLPLENTGAEWAVTITWTPEAEQVGSEILCYTAVENTGKQSETCCVTLIVQEMKPKPCRLRGRM